MKESVCQGEEGTLIPGAGEDRVREVGSFGCEKKSVVGEALLSVDFSVNGKASFICMAFQLSEVALRGTEF